MLATSGKIDAFLLEDFFLERFERSPCLGCADATLQLVPVVAGIVRPQVFILIHDLYSQCRKEWGRDLDYWESLAVMRLAGCERAGTMVRYDDLCFSRRVIYLHAMGGEACSNRLQSFSDLRKELVGCIRKDGYCEVVDVEEGRDGSFVRAFWGLLVKSVL